MADCVCACASVRLMILKYSGMSNTQIAIPNHLLSFEPNNKTVGTNPSLPRSHTRSDEGGRRQIFPATNASPHKRHHAARMALSFPFEHKLGSVAHTTPDHTWETTPWRLTPATTTHDERTHAPGDYISPQAPTLHLHWTHT